MSLICMKCGNIKRFFITSNVSGWGRSEYDGEAEEIGDRLDGETTDTDNTEFECRECDGEEIGDYQTDKELLEIQYEHTDKQGKWSYYELDENDRNKKIKDELFMEGI